MNNDDGFLLGELIISLPLNIMLLLAIVARMTFGFRRYSSSAGDWDVLEHVREPAEGSVMDIRYCEDFRILNDGIMVTIVHGDGTSKENRYRLKSGRRFRNGQPLMGDSMLSKVMVTEFRAERVDAYHVALKLEAENKLTGRAFAIDTTVTAYRKYANEKKKLAAGSP